MVAIAMENQAMGKNSMSGRVIAAGVKKRKKKSSNKKAKRKPIALVPPPMTSRKRARKVTSSFHNLTKKMDEIQQSDLDHAEKEKKIGMLEQELAQLGGRAAYQSASQLSTSFFSTSKWVMGELARLGRRPKKHQPPPRVLEVGAINNTLLTCPWLNVDAIDLKSTHPDIREIDFFKLKPKQEYDAVVSSMVINCVPCPYKRGEMLRGYRDHLRRPCSNANDGLEEAAGHFVATDQTQKENAESGSSGSCGLLFLTLPRRCLDCSRHLTAKLFEELLQGVGFEIIAKKESPKVAFFLCKLSEEYLAHGEGKWTSKAAQKMFTSADPTRKQKHLNHHKKFTNTFSVCLLQPGA
mmetsp:Transcript_43755/g.75578  ORF Transcript_43755/g.75578 Transcript_43755/m.75578 type:complete len:352 (-) Transcript_43755:245-1300(-)